MSFFKKDKTPTSHFTHPRLPIHPLIDIPTGEIIRGKHGDTIINGGYSSHLAFNGKNNGGKTALMISMLAAAFIKHKGCGIDGQIYECENTLDYMRVLNILNGTIKSLGFEDDEEGIRQYFLENFVLRNSSMLGANAWYDETCELSEERIKNVKSKIDLPFNDVFGQPVRSHIPHLASIDSFSALEPEVVAENYIEANTAGSKDNNMMYTADNRAKTQMLARWVNLNPKSAVYMSSTAHLGDNISLDPRSPPEKKNMFMKQNHKLKNVPEKYYFYTSTMFFVNHAEPLLASDKSPAYPIDSNDNMKKDAKDILLSLIVLRNKYGRSGDFIQLVMNQNTGIDWQLSALHHCRTQNFGISGSPHGWSLDLLPDVKMTGKSVRRAMASDKRIGRVADITCEMHLLFRFLSDRIASKYICTPAELYADLTALGYDWDMLLNTRGYYTFDHYDHPVKPLSTYDLLRMRVGDYVPYWMTDDQIPEKVKENMKLLEAA